MKLGDDLFSDQGMALNSSGIFANKDGAFHNDKYWSWKSKTELILTETNKTPELELLKNKAQGLIGLTDLYLKEEKARKNSSTADDKK